MIGLEGWNSCLLLDLFSVASAFRRSRNQSLVLIWFRSWSFSIFWYKISISVCFCTHLNPLKRWQVGHKLRKSFCGCVSSWSERFRNLSSLFIHASNFWWWPAKGSKALGTILVNSSTNSNLKSRHLSGNLKGS